MDYFTYFYVVKHRELFFYKNYFSAFYDSLTWKVQKKILWTLEIVEKIDRIPDIYFKHLENSAGLYEIRVQVGSNTYRIFCFFDSNDLVVVGHGFQKKTQKTPRQELDKAAEIKKQYYEEKKSHKS